MGINRWNYSELPAITIYTHATRRKTTKNQSTINLQLTAIWVDLKVHRSAEGPSGNTGRHFQYKRSPEAPDCHQSRFRRSHPAPLQHAGNLLQPPLSQRHLSYPSHVAALSFRSPSSSWPSSPSPPQLPAATVTNRRTRSTTTMQVPVMSFH